MSPEDERADRPCSSRSLPGGSDVAVNHNNNTTTAVGDAISLKRSDPFAVAQKLQVSSCSLRDVRHAHFSFSARSL